MYEIEWVAWWQRLLALWGDEMKREKTNYIRNIPVHIRKPGVLLPSTYMSACCYIHEESAEKTDRISHLIFYQNLYLSYL